MTGQTARATRNDVARLAGVSPALVSLVVNNRPHVRPEKRRKVLQAIADLGYEPDLTARGLRTRRTGLLAYLAGELMNPFSPDIALGMEEAADRLGYAVVICQPRDAALTALIRRRIDGVLVGSVSAKWLAQLRRHRIAVASLYCDGCPEDVSCVDTDWKEGVRLALEHLAGLGHRRVAMIGGERDEVRYRCYREECTRLGLAGRDRLAIGDWHIEGGYEAMVGLLNRREGVTGVFAGNDLMALGALQACRENGAAVPGDISVVGYDDIMMAVTSTPRLTTVRYPIREAGKAAVELLCEAMHGHAARHILLPARLVVRESSGVAPTGAGEGMEAPRAATARRAR